MYLLIEASPRHYPIYSFIYLLTHCPQSTRPFSRTGTRATTVCSRFSRDFQKHEIGEKARINEKWGYIHFQFLYKSIKADEDFLFIPTYIYTFLFCLLLVRDSYYNFHSFLFLHHCLAMAVVMNKKSQHIKR